MRLPLTISENQQRLLDKEYSAVELVDGYLGQIKSLEPKINAFITVCEDIAYKQAKAADKQISLLGKSAFDQFPLLATPVAFKDLYLTKGIRTTAASRVLSDYVPAYSATVVDRVENAGGIIIGKTNCDAWAHGASGENSDFLPTKNPWNIKFSPGGSSSGSAASVAAGETLVSFGTDTGGSIRQPANFCGLVGLKPTYGAVSRYGVIAMASSLDCMGNFARSVEDSQLLFATTCGEDGKDGTVVNFQSASWRTKSNFQGRKVKIGIPKEYFSDGLDRDVEKCVLEAVETFKKSDCELVDVSLPHTKYAIDVYYIIQPAEVSSNLGRYDGIRYGTHRCHFGAEAKRRIMLGTYVLSSGYYDQYYLKAMRVRNKIIQDFENAFSNVDLIISPVSPTCAFELGKKISDPLEMYLADIYTVAANLAGIPAIAVPSSKFTSNGLPLGFQLMGPRFSEEKLFSLAKLYHKAIDYKPYVANL